MAAQNIAAACSATAPAKRPVQCGGAHKHSANRKNTIAAHINAARNSYGWRHGISVNLQDFLIIL